VVFYAAIVWVPLRAGWTATLSEESVMSVQQFIPAEILIERSYEAAVLEIVRAEPAAPYHVSHDCSEHATSTPKLP
jgi:hypothetical protein